jgi:1-deoxy-D-xylulose-5-phosphate synthase
MILETIESPADLRRLSYDELATLATEIREFIVKAVSVTGGHLGSNLGVVELTLAIHRVFDSPADILLWDTGHQAYVHKIVTGRRHQFEELRQPGGLSGYPSRAESEHDWVENSHASTILSYAYGISTALHLRGADDRHVVAVLGDGSMTGGMAYEALNNLGHSGRKVVIVLNDNGRSYAPTISRLSAAATRLRANPSYVRHRDRIQAVLRDVPVIGEQLAAGAKGLRAAFREVLEPANFFESLGVRYIGPFDGHDVTSLEWALRHAAAHDGPIVVHALTQKGRGYAFAEDDEEKCLHDVKVFDPAIGPVRAKAGDYTEAFTEAIVAAAERDPKIVAITAAMPGPTGLLPFQARFPDRFVDVGIAEQHAVTAAAGLAMGGARPVVAVYSTFLTRAFDQTNLDVGLHHEPVIFCIDRAGITGEDGPSHHGVLDLALLLRVPGMTVLAPSSAQELQQMFVDALTLTGGPVAIRYPRGAARQVGLEQVGSGLAARRVREGHDVCILAVGKLLEAAEDAALLLDEQGVHATVWDARVVKPLDPVMIDDAARHSLVVTVEDGVRQGGAGEAMADAIERTQTIDLGVDIDVEVGPTRRPRVLVLGVPDRYIPQGRPAEIHADLGLDGPGIAAAIAKALGVRSIIGSAGV